jgi:hypothetical protein
MEYIILKIEKEVEIYCDKFYNVGWYVIDEIYLSTNPKYDNNFHTRVKAHYKDRPSIKIDATLDNFRTKE